MKEQLALAKKIDTMGFYTSYSLQFYAGILRSAGKFNEMVLAYQEAIEIQKSMNQLIILIGSLLFNSLYSLL